jgi:hypothetical protein
MTTRRELPTLPTFLTTPGMERNANLMKETTLGSQTFGCHVR